MKQNMNITKSIRDIISKMNFGLLALLFKIVPKFLSIFVKFAKFFKIGKFGLAIVSVASYAYLFTWKFAIMISILLLIHEYGHIWAMKRCGLKTKGIYFIPFLGAAAVSEDSFKSRRDEAYIAIMGPIFGLVLSVIFAVIYLVTKDTFFAASAGFMAMVNLFNLLPINPLDGGRIVKSITFSINSKFGIVFLVIGIIVSIVLMFWAKMVLFFILLVIGIIEFASEYYARSDMLLVYRCLGVLKEMDVDKLPPFVKEPYEKVVNLLKDKNVSASEKVDIILSKGKSISDIEKTVNEYSNEERGFSIMCHILLSVLRVRDNMPKMTIKGVLITTCVYVLTISMLWILAWYVKHIPEVDMARQFFMS